MCMKGVFSNKRTMGMDIRGVMKKSVQRIVWGVWVFLGMPMAHALIEFVDSYETDSSANYSLVTDGFPDGTVTFGYDYTNDGVPLAPRSAPGAGKGLRMTVNDLMAEPEAFTAYFKPPITYSSYKVEVDVYMAYQGVAGVTEFATVGVGGNGSNFNQFQFPTSGSGAFISFSGDGGSSSDYRWYRNASLTPSGDTASNLIPNTHPSYLGHGSDNNSPFFNALFPGGSAPGAPGNRWTTVMIDVNNGAIGFYFDGSKAFEGTYEGSLSGLVSLGLSDIFASLDDGSVYTLYDNLRISTAVPEPSGITLMGMGAVFALMRHRVRRWTK